MHATTTISSRLKDPSPLSESQAVTLIQGQTLTATLDWNGSGVVSLEVFDPGLRLVATGTGSGNNLALTYVATMYGVHTVQVALIGGQTANYTLQLSY